MNAPLRTLRLGAAEVRVFPTPADLSAAVADTFIQVASDTIAAQGQFTVALAGGSTPRAIYGRLAETAQRVTWDRVHLFFGDERPVPPQDSDSNFRMARESLLSRIPIPPQNVHRVRAELGAEAAAATYDAELRSFFGSSEPRFDLILLGMGPDGHTASLFPGSPALAQTDKLVVANPVAKLNTARITLTFPVLNRAARVWFLVVGAEKSSMLSRVLQGGSGDTYPAQRVRPAGELIWWTDEAAAEQLR